MKVTICQINIEWGYPHKNIENAERLMDKALDSDLYVLPEMWSTGFATEPQGIAENEQDSISLKWMKQVAKNRHCAIAGSLAIRSQISSPESYRNRHYFADGCNNTLYYYDKHHLFSYGHEDRYFESGTSHQVVAYKGFRFLLLTCYDLRFPVWSRYSSQLEFDAIIVVANWPESRQNAWQILTRARAIENQAFLIGCNRVGDDKFCHYRGQSAIISPIGKTLVSCPANESSFATYDIDLATVRHYRDKFKVLEDRDIF